MALKSKKTVIMMPGLELPLFIVENVEELITDLFDEDKIPLWAEIWPAARGLARYIWENVSFFGQSVLDLGSGLGMAGVVCGLKGARVTFSDYQEGALEMSRKNAVLNGIMDTRTHLGDWRSFDLGERFDWIVGSDILYDSRYHECLAGIFKSNTKENMGVIVSHPGRGPAFEFIKMWCEETGSREEHVVVPVYIPDPVFPYYEIHVHKMTKPD
ncbi:MAG: class I SAM-dependent methyltransferase [Bacillota bacterium]